MKDREICLKPSINGRLDTLQAAALLVNMKRYKRIYLKRRKIAEVYRAHLMENCELQPSEIGVEFRAYHTFPVAVNDRDAIRAELMREGIQIGVHHKYLMQDHPAYKHLVTQETPNARRIVPRLISLPIHDNMTTNDAEYVAETLKRILSARSPRLRKLAAKS